jgi:hypothetical protein
MVFMSGNLCDSMRRTNRITEVAAVAQHRIIAIVLPL